MHPFVFPPYRHQAREFDLYRDEPARALLWQMRSGKTKAMIDLACYNATAARITAVLVIAPNGVHGNWIRRELPKHHWTTVPRAGIVWHSVKATSKRWKEQFKQVLAHRGGLAWFALNNDALKTETGRAALRAFFKAHPKFLLIVDESHEFGSPGSRRTMTLRGLAPKAEMRRILSGTSVDESPLKAYSQFEVLGKAALGQGTYEEFKARYSVWETKKNWKTKREYEKLEGYVNQEELREHMARWSSVVLREDCDDMPELVRAPYPIVLTPEQAKVSKQLIDGAIQELDSGQFVSPTEGGALVIRLQQVSSGYVVDEDGLIVELVKPEQNPRLKALEATLALTLGKSIVWCRFTHEIKLVGDMLDRLGIVHVDYHGPVKQADRDRAIDRFQTDPEVRVFVGQPQAGGQGLDLSAAEDIIWFSHTYSAIQRKQADERATQLGGRTIGVTDIMAEVDHQMLEAQYNKGVVADFLAGRGLRDLLVQMREEIDE